MADDKLPMVPLQPDTAGLGCSRRQLVRGAALAACVPALGALVGCARRISPNRDVNVGPPVDGRLVVSTTDARELGRAGGAVVVHSPCIVNPVLVVNTGSGFLAMNALCPHANCEIAWVPEDRQAECPCHGSRFAGDGTVLNGPAVVDLAAYPAALDASGAVVISLFTGDKIFPAVSNGSVVIDLADPKYAKLQTPGGAIVGHPEGAPFPIVLTRPGPPTTAQGGIVVLSALCPHLACTVLPLSERLHCPCHGSVFLLDGTVLNGPAVDPLPQLPFTFRAGPPGPGTITVDQLGFTC
jgi:cytochrome b6-f complex iron-sulfur subunit